MVIKNLDNGLKTFGTNQPFERVSPFLFDAPSKKCISCGSRDESRDIERNLLHLLHLLPAIAATVFINDDADICLDRRYK